MPIPKRPSAKPAQASKQAKKPSRSAGRKPAAQHGKPAKKPEAAEPAVKAKSPSPPTLKPATAPSEPSPPSEPRPEKREQPPTDTALPTTILPTRVGELFRLNEAELRVLQALLQCSMEKTVFTLATELVLPLPQLLSLLAPEGVLRGRALVEVSDGAALGWALPSDVVHAGRGLALTLVASRQAGHGVDERTLFLATLPGLSYLPAPAVEAPWIHDLVPTTGAERWSEKLPATLVDLLRENGATPQPALLNLGGLQGEQLVALAQVARQRHQRPVVTLDGSALAGWPQPLIAQALRRLRRDTDLRGAILLLHDVRALGSAWRAALLPRPSGQTAPLFVASDLPALPLGVLPSGLRDEAAWHVVSLTLRPQPLPSPAPQAAPAISAAPSADASDENEDPAVAASRQEARRQAAIDAARAMGRPIPKELLTPTPVAKPAPATTAATATTATVQARPATQPEAAAPAPTPPASKPAASPPPSPAVDAAARRAMNPRLAAALAAAGLPPPGSDAYANSEYAQRRAAARAAAAAEREAAPPPASVPAATTPPAAPAEVAAVAVAAPATTQDGPADMPTTQSTPAQTASPTQTEEGAPLPLEAEAPLEELIRVARTTPNSAQRVELLRKLTGARHSAVIQLFRTFVSSPHPGVREAAEGGMSSLFGPNWNRSRNIAPPTQPPRTDDGGRGPGGAF